MTDEQRQKLEAMAASQAKCSPGDERMANQATGIGADGLCAAPSFREQISSQRYHAQVSARRAEQLMELEYLLDKHPDVSRILELLEVVRG